MLHTTADPAHNASPVLTSESNTLQVVTLLASARGSIEVDPGLTRHYLDQLSALFGSASEKSLPAAALIPERAQGGVRTGKGGLTGWQIRKVADHVERRLAETILTDDLARAVQLSAGHFSRAFKASMGEAPHAYIVRQRIRRAQILMLRTRDTLSQIACACGLTDQAHLTRLFRRVAGTTPMAWRRTWQCLG